VTIRRRPRERAQTYGSSVSRANVALWPAVALGVLVTLLVSVFPGVPAAASLPTLRVVLDTVVSLVALLLAYLVYGRFLLRRQPGDLVLVFGLGLSAVLNATLAVAPQLGAHGPLALTLLAWGPLVGRVVVAVIFVVAAWTPLVRRPARPHPALVVVTACLVVTMLVVGVIVAAAHLLPASAVPDLDPRGPVLRTAGSGGLVAALGLLGAVLFALGAAGFRRRRGDPLAPALTAASALLAAALLNYALVPSLYPQWVYSGDVLRLAAYGVLLLGATGEIRRYWADSARVAVQEERRRVARSLHDGVAQEVSLLATQMRLWSAGRPSLEPRLLAGCAERALEESRAAISALQSAPDEPLDRALLRLADDVEGRLGVQVLTHVAAVPTLSPPARDALLRAAREAVVNAARHSGSDCVEVTLDGDGDGDGDVRLTVVDVGRGFEPTASRRGFGLEGVRGRLGTVGGKLAVVSSPGRGTRVEVLVPCPT
jgi:signal transduction histidine kinase